MYWGRQDDQSAIRAINAALNEGVNWIDTAPFYGWGRAEEIVGKAVKGRRDGVYIHKMWNLAGTAMWARLRVIGQRL